MPNKLKLAIFYEDLGDLLGLTPKKDVLVITGDWNAKVHNSPEEGAGLLNPSL